MNGICPMSDNSQIPLLPAKRVCPFNPPPEYKKLRINQPISRVRTKRGDVAWLVTRYEDICQILVDKRFSSDPTKPGFPTYITGKVPPPPGFFLQADAPDHTRLRQAVTQDFLAAQVKKLRPRMQEIFDDALEKMLTMKPPVDFVKVLAIPVASRIICELLGVPFEYYDFIKEQTDIVLNQGQAAIETEKAAVVLMDCFAKIVTEKIKYPTDDLLGHLILNAKTSGQPSHQELTGLAALLLLSAYDTMALIMSLGVVVLLEHPDQLSDFLKDPTLGAVLVHELARYLTINHSGLPRTALENVEVGGQLIQAGEGVILMLSSGNRDEAVFKDADNFDIYRKEHRHLGFGHGIHKCLGIHFAQVELQVAFSTLFKRVPSLRLATTKDKLVFRHEMVLYGLKTLPVTWAKEERNKK